jgi:hypothetical protein
MTKDDFIIEVILREVTGDERATDKVEMLSMYCDRMIKFAHLLADRMEKQGIEFEVETDDNEEDNWKNG